ncbi:hypothetical protein L226DRAFT_606841 [Lentinus tigrinus ALCF2SS1-7]|uniref:uncharacterized protein n=1 Tax=Lentinus tigrinus ALCF2SS1-7 TaxID=1328758 RepID=UPI0011661A94|nr:hypothetical protein L226DRAFT_606841 [Lentinus tigrinus ALCF2SS1-7]
MFSSLSIDRGPLPPQDNDLGSSSSTSSGCSHGSSSDQDSDSGYSSFQSDDPPHAWDGTSRSLSALCPQTKIDLSTDEDRMSHDDEGPDHVDTDSEGADSDTEDFSADYVRLPLHCLRDLLSLLPSLATLSLDKLSFCHGTSTYCNPAAAPETPDGRTIQRLYIEDCSSPGQDANHFFAVLGLFSEVQVLCVDGGPWRVDQPCLVSRVPIICGLVLGALEETNCAIAFYDSLRRSGSLGGPLKSIRFTGFTREEMEAFFGFAENAGPNLIDLELDIYYAINDSPGLPESWESFTLDFCSRLETLTFSFDFEDEEQPACVCLEVVRTCLRFYTHLLSSRSVQRTLRIVTFQVFHAPVAPFNFRRSAESSSVPRWTELDNVLAGLPELSYVKFMLCDVDGRGTEVEETKAGMAAFLQQYMPRMWWSGQVRMSLEEEEFGEMFQY